MLALAGLFASIVCLSSAQTDFFDLNCPAYFKPDCPGPVSHQAEACPSCAKCQKFCEVYYGYPDNAVCIYRDESVNQDKRAADILYGIKCYPQLHGCVCISPNERYKYLTQRCNAYCRSGGYARGIVKAIAAKPYNNCNANSRLCSLGQYIGKIPESARTSFLAKLNSHRSNVALGNELNKKGRTPKKLPKAKLMYKIKHSTTLEWVARAHLSACPRNAASQTYWGSIGMNGAFRSLKGKNTTPAKFLTQYLKASWGQLRANGAVISQAGNVMSTGVFSWAQLALDFVTRFGCAVHYCQDQDKTLLLCLYNRQIAGNNVIGIPLPKNWVVYSKGKPCTKKTDCTYIYHMESTCDVKKGLCQ